MNQLSYHVSDDKLKSRGLILKENLDKDIKNTLEILKKYFMICKITQKKIKPFMSFGKMPIANGFIKKNFKKRILL